MGYLGEEIKKLGFGLMRLPHKDGEIDITRVKEMVDLFMAQGFTYFDTAFTYSAGKSEAAVKAALVDRYPRESFQLATKMPAYLRDSAQAAQAMFWTSLERTGAGYFDYYLMHNLGAERSKAFDDYGIWDFLAQQKEAGRIRHVGFSFHDKADVLDKILTAHPETEFVQLQINYADWEDETIQSRACYETARRHGKPVIIMEPVKGGALAGLPEQAAEVFKQADPGASVASWALRFAASLEGLIAVLSGMSDLAQMRDNLQTMENFRPVDARERTIYERVVEILKSRPNVPCTACRYCVDDCPQNINIPGAFEAMNMELVFNNAAGARHTYGWIMGDGARACDCIGCGQCESVCPQHIEIISQLRQAAEMFH